MREKGMGPRMDETHPKPTRDQFLNNYKIYDQALTQLTQQQNKANIKPQLQAQMENMRGILIRQIMTGLYVEASPHYMRKLSEQKAIAAELQKLTGRTYVNGAENEILLNMSEMMRDLQNTM